MVLKPTAESLDSCLIPAHFSKPVPLILLLIRILVIRKTMMIISAQFTKMREKASDYEQIDYFCRKI